MSTTTRERPRAYQVLLRVTQTLSIPILAVVAAMVIGAMIIIVSGASPLGGYMAMLKGALGSTRGVARTFEKATPLVFSGLAVAFAFKAGLFNIGAQGQLLLGAISAAVVGFWVKGLPPLFHVALALLAGMVAGALWGLVPGALKALTGAHEVITTIMLNFVAINLTDYLANGPLKDRTPGNIVARTPAILESAELPPIGPVPAGVLISVGVAIAVWWVLIRTTLGFEIKTVGLNADAARYAGIRVGWTMILAMMISGLLAGLGGAVETLGIVGRFQPGFNTGLGFDGITIALLAQTNSIGVIPAALLFGVMRAGANQMQLYGVDAEIIGIVQGTTLFFVSAPIVIRKLLRIRAEGREDVILSTGWGQAG